MSYGKPDGTLEASRGYVEIHQAAVEVGYINNDTLLDIIARSTSQTLVLLNQSNRQFEISFGQFNRSFAAAASVPSVAVGYYNADARLDILASPDLVYFGDGTGGFPSGASLNEPLMSLESVDLNGDFLDDLIGVVGDSVRLYLNSGNASFSRSGAAYLAYRTFDAATVIAGDLSRDGRPDVAVITRMQGSPDSASQIAILLGNGSGGIAATDTFSIVGEVASASLCDVDRDNDLDLSIINSTTNELLVYLGDGAGAFGDSLSVPVGTGTESLQILAPADLDRDANRDCGAGGYSAAIVRATPHRPPADILPDQRATTGYGGFDLSVINPRDYQISRLEQTVAGSAWWSTDVNNDDVRDVRTYDYNLQNGEYQFIIRPTPIVPPDGAFTMDIRLNGSHQIASYVNYTGTSVGMSAKANPLVADSMIFYYTVEPVSSMNPPNGERTSSRQPVFIWAKLMDSTAEAFQFQMDQDYYFVSPDIDVSIATPRYPCPVPLDTGEVYYWRARVSGGSWSRTMAAYIGTGCCVQYPGNVNQSVSETPDLSDLSLLIAYMVQTPRPTLPCTSEANVNGTGPIDLSDLSLLIAYLVQSPRPVLPACP